MAPNKWALRETTLLGTLIRLVTTPSVVCFHFNFPSPRYLQGHGVWSKDYEPYQFLTDYNYHKDYLLGGGVRRGEAGGRGGYALLGSFPFPVTLSLFGLVLFSFPHTLTS